MAKTLLIAAVLSCASLAQADAIVYRGIVTDAPANYRVQVGDTFEGYQLFYVWDPVTYEPWTPGALDFSCYIGSCGSGGVMAGQYLADVGGHGITYSSGVSRTFPSFGLDGFSIQLDSDLNIVRFATGPGYSVHWGATPSSRHFSEFYTHPEYRTIYGELLDARFVSEIPEPSVLSTCAIGLVLVIAIRRYRAMAC
jgi:hypothetical protein